MKLLSKFGVEVHERKMRNGASLFLFKRKGMPVYLRATFFAGSRFDSISGTAHFLEHILVAGTKKFPGKNLIADYIQKIGGDFGASTNNNVLRLNVEIPEAQDIDVGIEVMSECLNNSLFDDQMIENERGAILSEIQSKKSNPKEYIAEVQRRVSLQGTTAARSTLGSEASIKNITKNNLISYREEFVNSGRMNFVASGDISAEMLIDKLNSINLEAGDKLSVKEKLPIIREIDTDVEFYKNVNHLQVVLVCRTDIEDYAEYCSLMVLNSIIAGGRGSRLMTRLRYENGLVYTISSSVFNTIDWGTLKISLSCSKDNLDKVKDLIFKEFNALRQDNISSTELENVKLKISKGSIRHFQTSKAWVDFHENDALFSPSDLHTAEDYIKTINKLTLGDMEKVINKYIFKENFYTAICGDYQK